MSEIQCPIVKLHRQKLKGKNIAIIFDTLPEMQDWATTLLDITTRNFLNNIVPSLGKKGASFQIHNDKETIVNLIVNSAFKKYLVALNMESTLKEVSKEDLFENIDAVVGLGLSKKTVEELNKLNIPCVVIRTGKNEVFPNSAKVLEGDPSFEIANAVNELVELLKS